LGDLDPTLVVVGVIGKLVPKLPVNRPYFPSKIAVLKQIEPKKLKKNTLLERVVPISRKILG
jgi:hypothetical protein